MFFQRWRNDDKIWLDYVLTGPDSFEIVTPIRIWSSFNKRGTHLTNLIHKYPCSVEMCTTTAISRAILSLSCIIAIIYFLYFRFRTIFDSVSKSEIKHDQLEEDTDNTTIDQNEYTISYKEILCNLISILKGENDILMRSTNIIHVLGSVSVSIY